MNRLTTKKYQSVVTQHTHPATMNIRKNQDHNHKAQTKDSEPMKPKTSSSNPKPNPNRWTPNEATPHKFLKEIQLAVKVRLTIKLIIANET